jgi:hypothetical protein
METFLTDPSSLTVHQWRRNHEKRTFVILGEYHQNPQKRGCKKQAMSIVEFFHEIANRVPSSDLFLESPLPLTKQTRLYQNSVLHWIYKMFHEDQYIHGLSSLLQQFGECAPKYGGDTSNCGNMRVHLIDFRELESYGWSYESVQKDPESLARLRLFLNHVGFASIHSMSDSSLPDNSDMDHFYTLCSTLYKHRDPLLRALLHTFKIKKQLQAISSRRVREQILDVMYRKWSTLWNKIQRLLRNADKRKSFHNLADLYVRASTIPVDLYMMARALRTFRDGTHATNIMVYAGEYHAENYRDMLHAIGATTVLDRRSSRNESACIRVSVNEIAKYLLP